MSPQPATHHLRAVTDSGRPQIRIGTDPDAIRVLRAELDARVLPDTYVTDGEVVVVEAVSGTGEAPATTANVPLPLAATPLKPARFASLLADHTEVVQPQVRRGNAVEEEVSPAREVLGAVLAHRSWPGLPVLRRIINTPVLRPSGTLLQHPGYDRETGLLLTDARDLPSVPDRPTPDQVDQACRFLLDEFLGDFPWRDPAADRANYIALLVTPILRPFLRALTPFGIVDATMPGSGKSILTGCIGLLNGQRVLSWTDNDEELRKQITTVIGEQVGVIVFDNLIEGTVIDSAVLARLATEHVWSDRRLSTNTSANIPNDKLWLATGNNLHTGGDMASRSVWVRLDPDCPHPEARTGFVIDDLPTWILNPTNQATILRHLLVLVLDWTAHGAPTSTAVPTMRQFTRWARALGGFLDHHGIPGFLTNLDTNRTLDTAGEQWGAFLRRWYHLHHTTRFTAAQLRGTAIDPTTTDHDPWIGTFPTTRAGRLPHPGQLGMWLAGQENRWRDTVVLRSVTDRHTKIRSYWVETSDTANAAPEQTSNRSPQSPQVPANPP